MRYRSRRFRRGLLTHNTVVRFFLLGGRARAGRPCLGCIGLLLDPFLSLKSVIKIGFKCPFAKAGTNLIDNLS